MQDFLKKLSIRLSQPLPGQAQQIQMAARMEGVQKPESLLIPKANAQAGAVLLMLHEQKGEWSFPLIQRPDYDGAHGGQVAFPGGKVEQTDTDLAHTALRETEEEIGIDSSQIQVIGKLTPLYVFVSNIMVHPFVGFYPESPDYEPDSEEVAEVLETPLDTFINAQIKEINFKPRAQTIVAPYYDLHDRIVWGATAMMLCEFKKIVADISI